MIADRVELYTVSLLAFSLKNVLVSYCVVGNHSKQEEIAKSGGSNVHFVSVSNAKYKIKLFQSWNDLVSS